MPHDTAKSQIRTLLGILSAAVITAVLLSAGFVYYYGPSGKYLAKNVLLEPGLAPTLAYDDTNYKTGGMSRYVFNGIDFNFYDTEGKPQVMEVPIALYQKLYNRIANDSSLLQVPEGVTSLFNKPDLNVLTIRVRTESHATWQDDAKNFQQIQFSPQSDYYRIQLHEEASLNRWVYFLHPNIYQETLQTFIL